MNEETHSPQVWAALKHGPRLMEEQFGANEQLTLFIEDAATLTICFTTFESVSFDALVSCSDIMDDNTSGVTSCFLTIILLVKDSDASSGLKAVTYICFSKFELSTPDGRVMTAYVSSDLDCIASAVPAFVTYPNA
jgi:hypothetical protein